ncbi:MAG: HNH endonuclease [Rhizobiales bacterium]|nr:HNH endonuclease [Hyphomicrobiales bacterium]NRB15031.1 HNH endonuclease [Hyphomicrobiales bacterium]
MLASPTRCKKRGCPWKVRGCVHHIHCQTPDVDLSKLSKQTPARKLYDDRRGSSTARGYDSHWQKSRIGFLSNNPLCVFCKRVGIVTAAVLVDHIKPHKDDKKLFWKRDNWQALCAHHHNADKASIESKWLKGLLPDEALQGIGVQLSMPD